MKLSRYHVVTPAIVDAIDQMTKRIVYATRIAQLRVLTTAAWDRVENGKLDDLPADLVADLVAIELLVPSGEDELTTVLARNNTAAANTEALAVVVQPTALCQLGCGYCGQAHK